MMQEHWAIGRQVGYYVVAMNQGKKGRIKKPTDLFKLDLDKPKRSKEIKLARVRRIDG